MNRSLKTRTVLVVEDETALRSVLARHLLRQGAEVTAVETAEAALAEVTRRSAGFDVVVSDVHLPGLSGLDLATRLLARDAGQPVILITGDADVALARDALARGPVGYLLKPFEMARLDAAVAQAVALRKPAPSALPEAEPAGRVPLSWLDLADEQSYAGKGHARRVARIAMALAETARSLESRLDVGELVVAAWSHELGRLSGEGSDPVAVATAGARMLTELGCAAGVVEGVRHLHEHYDGTGGPGRLAGAAIPPVSLLLAVADALEHYVAAWQHAGREAAEAVERALRLVRVQSGSVFSPEAVEAARRQRQRIVAICAEAGATVARPAVAKAG